MNSEFRNNCHNLFSIINSIYDSKRNNNGKKGVALVAETNVQNVQKIDAYSLYKGVQIVKKS